MQNMAENKQPVLSPTVTLLLDEFISAMQSDDTISDETIGRLDELIRIGRTPKSEEVMNSVFPPTESED